MADQITRTQWLVRKALIAGVPSRKVREAVDTALFAHPEWDPDEMRTWAQWQTHEAR